MPELSLVTHLCHVAHMRKSIHITNVPEHLHHKLSERAQARGLTLSDYILSMLERQVGRPPADEVFQRIRARPAVDLGRPAAELIREERAAADVR